MPQLLIEPLLPFLPSLRPASNVSMPVLSNPVRRRSVHQLVTLHSHVGPNLRLFLAAFYCILLPARHTFALKILTEHEFTIHLGFYNFEKFFVLFGIFQYLIVGLAEKSFKNSTGKPIKINL